MDSYNKLYNKLPIILYFHYARTKISLYCPMHYLSRNWWLKQAETPEIEEVKVDIIQVGETVHYTISSFPVLTIELRHCVTSVLDDRGKSSTIFCTNVPTQLWMSCRVLKLLRVDLLWYGSGCLVCMQCWYNSGSKIEASDHMLKLTCHKDGSVLWLWRLRTALPSSVTYTNIAMGPDPGAWSNWSRDVKRMQLLQFIIVW